MTVPDIRPHAIRAMLQTPATLARFIAGLPSQYNGRLAADAHLTVME
jgi:hypothetical protein